ncbi:MAG: hypothetical protein R3A10_09545 [Caldilineaceae bacterium]
MAITISLPRSSGRTASWCATRRSRYWSDGFDKLGDASYDGFVTRITKEKSGWINIPIGPGSSYVPERGESGPWCWAPSGAADASSVAPGCRPRITSPPLPCGRP